MEKDPTLLDVIKLWSSIVWYVASSPFKTALDNWKSSQLDVRFKRAKTRFANGQCSQALTDYMFVFEQSRDCGGWAGVRLSFLLSDVERLGQSYPPALEKLLALRTSREDKMRAGVDDFDVVEEWYAINHYLNRQRTFEFYDELCKNQASFIEPVRSEIRRLARDEFLLEGRHAAFSEDDLKWFLRCLLSSLEVLEPYAKRAFCSAELQETIRQNYLKDARVLFEIALLRDDNVMAEATYGVVLKINKSADTYWSFFEAAERASSAFWTKRLLSDARDLFPVHDSD